MPLAGALPAASGAAALLGDEFCRLLFHQGLLQAGQNRSGFGEEAYPEVLKVAHFARELCYLGRACL